MKYDNFSNTLMNLSPLTWTLRLQNTTCTEASKCIKSDYVIKRTSIHGHEIGARAGTQAVLAYTWS